MTDAATDAITDADLRHPLVQEYLRHLEREARDLPPAVRRDLIAEIRGHLGEALAGDEGTESAVRNVLAALGDPRDIVAAAAPDGNSAEQRGPGWRESAALILLLAGGFVPPVLGWFAGVALLWSSRAWTPGAKLLGTLVVPGGLLLPFLLLSLASPVGSLELVIGVPLLIALVIAPIAVVVYLWRAAFRTA